MTSLEVIRFFWLRHVWTHWFFRQPGLFWTYIIPTSIYGNSEIDSTAHSRFHSDLWICPCAEGMIGTSGAKNWVWGGPFFQWWPYPNKHNKFYSLNHTSFLIRQQWKKPLLSPCESQSWCEKKKKYLGATATGPTSVYLVIIRQHSWFKKKQFLSESELGISILVSILVAVLRGHIPLNHDGQSWKTSCHKC